MPKVNYYLNGPGLTNRLAVPTNLFNVYTKGAGSVMSNGGGGNNGNRSALKRRAVLSKGNMSKPKVSTVKCCHSNI